MSNFLDFVGKHRVYNCWISAEPGLNASELKVLFRLLDHQNPKTGRCDPTIVRLSADTNIGTRMVRKAIKGLEERGAINVYRRAKGLRNAYCIRDVVARPSKQSSGKLNSKKGEPQFQNTGSQGPPKKEMKKKEKEKSAVVAHQTRIVAKTVPTEDSNKRKEELLEKAAVIAFERAGMTYSDLLQTPTDIWDSNRDLYVAGGLAIEAACAALVETASEANKYNARYGGQDSCDGELQESCDGELKE